ncbi:hypothetical protein B0H19DRAFT_542031 [Mycena capillaripes]|nr:hypothetical protein B0H19DRAFT_542031 [Mycena capillaripes]
MRAKVGSSSAQSQRALTQLHNHNPSQLCQQTQPPRPSQDLRGESSPQFPRSGYLYTVNLNSKKLSLYCICFRTHPQLPVSFPVRYIYHAGLSL